MRIQRREKREEWFKIEEDEDGAELHIRHLTDDDMSSIARQNMKQVVGKSGEVEFVSDPEKVTKALYVASFIGWKHIQDSNGKPLKFNERNMLRALGYGADPNEKIDGLAEYVSKFKLELAEMVEAEKAENQD